MGVRTRIRSIVTKTFGTNVPPEVLAGEAAAGMTPTRPFSPGEPIGPYDGYSRTPRSLDFTTGVNIATRPRTHQRVSFETLRGLVEAYDIAQMCIWHRIDSIRSLEWSLIPAKGHRGDVSDAIPVGMAALAKPDRQTRFGPWLATWLYDTLAYDAGALYRMRNRRGDAVGLRTVDGTTIAPLLDYWGNTPEGDAPAFVQYANGLPWNWLTTRDLIYTPFRKRANSPYGYAPLESILLNANTDLRFQAYFLQRFTEGNIPEAFASAPESWTPQQIEDFQGYWDSAMYGDQAVKHQIKWLPGGSTLAWSNEKDFQDHFSLFLMRKTCAAYHVVPADMGFTESVNRSTGESQADVQHRIGDLPLIRHIQGTLSGFLQEDLRLPLEFAFDLGEEQADRVEQAQADKAYVEMGAISPSTVRELRYGLPEPDGRPVPRFIYTAHAGPIPLSSLYAVAGDIDPETAAPDPDAPLPETVFGGAQGVEPEPPIKTLPLAERIYGLDAMPPAPPPQPQTPDTPVTKDGAPTAGITTATGITGHDLDRRHRDDEDQPDADEQADLAKAELAAFRTFRKGRVRAGRWRDFQFRAVAPRTARQLNQGGRLAVRKAAGEVAVAGLAVRAADTGRVLMIQRALDATDPAAGTWEFPGGHLEGDETPLEGAWREWAEETGCIPPPGEQTGTWIAPNGVYRGIVWSVASEASVPIGGNRGLVTNPDDPDGDQVEAIAWWDPNQLDGNPAMRPGLLVCLPDVLTALGIPPGGGELLVKAGTGDGDPKAHGGDDWPGWEHDQRIARHWAPLIAAALLGTLTLTTAAGIAGRYKADRPGAREPRRGAQVAAVAAWLAAQGVTDSGSALVEPLTGLYTDAYMVGVTAAYAAVDGTRPQVDGWTPGDTATARGRVTELGAAAGLGVALAAVDTVANTIADGRLKDAARTLIDGTDDGLAVDELAVALRETLADEEQAEADALTATTSASSAGAVDTYPTLGVTLGRWQTERDGRVCPTCTGNESAGPVPIGHPYPSGDTTAPAHPRCRCAVMPA